MMNLFFNLIISQCCTAGGGAAVVQFGQQKNFKNFQFFFFNFAILTWFLPNCPYQFCIISWPIGRPPAERRGVQGGDPPAKAKRRLLKYFKKKATTRGPLLVLLLLVRISNQYGFLKLKNRTKFPINSFFFIFEIYFFAILPFAKNSEFFSDFFPDFFCCIVFPHILSSLEQFPHLYVL